MSDPVNPPEANHVKYPNPPDVKGKRFPNPPETELPGPATLQEQWRYAMRMYARMYSQAWGTAILAGVGCFAIGWYIRGGNPIEFALKGDDKSKREGEQATRGDKNDAG